MPLALLLTVVQISLTGTKCYHGPAIQEESHCMLPALYLRVAFSAAFYERWLETTQTVGAVQQN